MTYDCVVVGAGICGLSAARKLADNSKKVLVIERTNRIGGLCKEGHWKGTRFCIFGPHIFHTDYEEVWYFLSQFTAWTYFDSSVYVKSFDCGKLWTIPIDYKEIPSPDLNEYIVIDRLYNNYNRKMWGKYYDQVGDYSLKRLNLNPSYSWDHRYFKDKYQAFPSNGYDGMFMKMSDHPNITIVLNGEFKIDKLDKSIPVIYTGRIDKLLDSKLWELPFRTMSFEIVLNGEFPWSDKYGVINFPNDFDFIRAHSSKVLYKQETKEDVVVYEYPGGGNTDCYPVVYPDSSEMYLNILNSVKRKYPNVIPAGRAGKFEYMNMDQACLNGLYIAEKVLKNENI